MNIDDNIWFDDYFKLYKKTLFNNNINNNLTLFKQLILDANKEKNKIIFTGNGGSAAMASHCAVDLTKNAKIRCLNFNEASIITCFSNDYGFDH